MNDNAEIRARFDRAFESGQYAECVRLAPALAADPDHVQPLILQGFGYGPDTAPEDMPAPNKSDNRERLQLLLDALEAIGAPARWTAEVSRLLPAEGGEGIAVLRMLGPDDAPEGGGSVSPPPRPKAKRVSLFDFFRFYCNYNERSQIVRLRPENAKKNDIFCILYAPQAGRPGNAPETLTAAAPYIVHGGSQN